MFGVFNVQVSYYFEKVLNSQPDDRSSPIKLTMAARAIGTFGAGVGACAPLT